MVMSERLMESVDSAAVVLGRLQLLRRLDEEAVALLSAPLGVYDVATLRVPALQCLRQRLNSCVVREVGKG